MVKHVSLFIMLLCCCATLHGQVVVRKHNAKLSASTVGRMRSAADGMVNVYVRLAEGADTARLADVYGVKFNVGYGRVFTAVVPAGSVEALAADDAVVAVDAGHEVRMMTDEARRLSGIDEVHAGVSLPAPYRGEGVLVGVIDAGFDFSHPNFRDAAGGCRILAAWDQNNFFATDSEYGYGREYRTAAEVAAAGRDMELTGDTHGTHVLGIAAGGYDGPYMGMAPEAGIVLVSTNKTEQGIVDGIDYLLKYSEKAGMPMSINLSIGSVLGYKDGTDDFAVLVDSLMKDKPGRVLSIAGGNEGDRKSTLHGVPDGEDCSVESYWLPPSYNRDNLLVQGVAGSDYGLTVSLVDTVSGGIVFSATVNSGEHGTVSYEDFGTQDGDNGSLVVSSAENPANGNPCFRVSMTYGKPDNEAWVVRLTSDGGRYAVFSDYGEFASCGKAGYADGVCDYTIAATAAGYNTIAVGAYVSKNTYTDLAGGAHAFDWTLGGVYPLSGRGPTYDGRIKPDVSAPGAAVMSSFNSYASSFYVKPEDKVAEVDDAASGRTYSWGVASGTSMAAPVVAGTVALWLEADPSLTVDDVRGIIGATSRRDGFTGADANGSYGYGKLDAMAGLKYVLQESSIVSNTVGDVTCRYADGRVIVAGGEVLRSVRVYGVDGTLVGESSGNGRSLSVKVPHGGVYIIKVETDSGRATFKAFF